MKETKSKDDSNLNYALVTRIFSWSIITLISIFFAILILLFKGGVVLKIVSIDASASVINASKMNVTKLGVSVDPDKLVFGIVPAGGNVTREINLKAPSSARKSMIMISAQGNISEKLRMDKKLLTLFPGESLNVRIKFIGDEIGNYTGAVHVLICVPRYGVVERFLDVVCQKAFEDWTKEHIKIS